MRGMSQEQLAEKAEISRSLISAIEAPGVAKSFSLDVFSILPTRLTLIPQT
jgi:DNA-binding helix-turn-helix protein